MVIYFRLDTPPDNNHGAKYIQHDKTEPHTKLMLRDRSNKASSRHTRTDASAVAAVAAAAAFPPEALPPAGLADFHPSSPPLEAGVEAVVDAGEGVTGTGGRASAPPFVADPAAGGGVAGGAPPDFSPPLPPLFITPIESIEPRPGERLFERMTVTNNLTAIKFIIRMA